jgi:DNA-binding transcriptional regulator YiaG
MTEPHFAQVIYDWRTRKHMSQAAAADWLGVSRKAWQSWELGNRLPDAFKRATILEKIAQDEKTR